jgi:hypothetical protein
VRLVPELGLHERDCIIERAQFGFRRNRFDACRKPEQVDEGHDPVLQMPACDFLGHGSRF